MTTEIDGPFSCSGFTASPERTERMTVVIIGRERSMTRDSINTHDTDHEPATEAT